MHAFTLVRDAGAGGAGGARAPPSFGISVNPIRTKGADYARHITTVPPHLFGRCGVSVWDCVLLRNKDCISKELKTKL